MLDLIALLRQNQITTWADTPLRLERRFKTVGEGRKRSWERYRNEAPTPAIVLKGRPGIVSIVGAYRPQTRAVFEHEFWPALDPSLSFDVATTNLAMQKLHPWVWQPFFYVETLHGQRLRDWDYIDNEEEDWAWLTDEYDLVLDMLAFYLLLFREAKAHERLRTAHRAAVRLRVLLEDWGSRHHLLIRCHPTLTRFILDNLIGSDYQEADASIPHVYLWPSEGGS